MPDGEYSAELLHILANGSTPSEKLDHLHRLLCARIPEIERISVALYDPDTDQVKTFIHSSNGDNPLPQYEATLASAGSLKTMAETRSARVINDLTVFAHHPKPHTRRLADQGYRSSYTLPMFRRANLFGFIFFDSRTPNLMVGEHLYHLDLFGHLIAMVVSNELHTIYTLKGIARAMGDVTQFRDVETASHLDRMSRFARLIAQQLAPRLGHDDEFVEYVFLFSPLHDIGKIAIPDRILLKPGKLTDDETVVMRSHVRRGREMIDKVLQDMHLFALPHITMLRNIIEHHHEAWNGSGYPQGLRGEAIPLEARIVSVADVFDALASRRPYKHAWTNESAITYVKEHTGQIFDPGCVEALVENQDKIIEIQQRFAENALA